MFSAYRSQSTDLQCKSIDWFLYVGNIRMKKVKVMETNRQKAMSWLNKYTEKRRKNKDVSNIIKITTEYSLRESVRIRSFSGPYFTDPNAGKYGPEKLRIRTISMQWLLEMARDQYKKLTSEQKNKIREYWKNRYRNMSQEDI